MPQAKEVECESVEFMMLPDELLLKIIEAVPVWSRRRLRAVNSRFSNIIDGIITELYIHNTSAFLTLDLMLTKIQRCSHSLRHLFLGGIFFTTEHAYERFVACVNACDHLTALSLTPATAGRFSIVPRHFERVTNFVAGHWYDPSMTRPMSMQIDSFGGIWKQRNYYLVHECKPRASRPGVSRDPPLGCVPTATSSGASARSSLEIGLWLTIDLAANQMATASYKYDVFGGAYEYPVPAYDANGLRSLDKPTRSRRPCPPVVELYPQNFEETTDAITLTWIQCVVIVGAPLHLFDRLCVADGHSVVAYVEWHFIPAVRHMVAPGILLLPMFPGFR